MFELFDKDKDSHLNREELRNALELLYEIKRRNQLDSIPHIVRVFVVVYFLLFIRI